MINEWVNTFNDDWINKGSTLLRRYLSESLRSGSETDHIL